MPREQLMLSALVVGEVDDLDRVALEKELGTAIDGVAKKFGLSLRETLNGDRVVVENDILGVTLDHEHSEEDEIPLGPSPMMEPD